MELVNEIWLVNKTKLGNFHLFFAKIGVCQKPFKLGHFSLIFGHFILISGRHLIGDCCEYRDAKTVFNHISSNCGSMVDLLMSVHIPSILAGTNVLVVNF